ncbi:ABC transporter substrate-binding protein [Paenibacillaceae bacterium WGS1546]|uniref:ABC transporter substrate-binding protein n=1 Tax=Cohnella sp. WGS1546 TaxID=3366810 RepID=UPI00372CFB0B
MRGLKIKKKSGAMTAFALSGMLLATACGNSGNGESEAGPGSSAEASASPQKVTLSVMAHASWIKGGMEAIVKDAADKIGITLEIEKVAEGAEGDNLIKTRFATNDKPDILFYYSGSQATELGKMETEFVPQEDQPWFANFDSDAWKGAMDAEGRFYGAPLGGAQAGVVFYNKQVFADLQLGIPRTMDEFWQTAEALKQAGKIPVYLAGKDAWTLQLPPMMTAASPDYTDLVGRINANQAKLTDMADLKKGNDLMLELKSKAYVNKNFLSDTYDNAQKAIANGDAGMYLMASWMMTDIVNKYPDKANDLGAFMLPSEDGAPRLPVFAPNAMYVVKGGKKQEAAQRFVNYFASIEAQNVYFSNEGGIPAIKGVTETSLTPAEEEVKALIDQGGGKPAFPAGLLYGAGDFGSFLQDSLSGGRSTEAVLEGMQQEFVKNAKVKDDPNFE